MVEAGFAFYKNPSLLSLEPMTSCSMGCSKSRSSFTTDILLIGWFLKGHLKSMLNSTIKIKVPQKISVLMLTPAHSIVGGKMETTHLLKWVPDYLCLPNSLTFRQYVSDSQNYFKRTKQIKELNWREKILFGPFDFKKMGREELSTSSSGCENLKFFAHQHHI